MSDNLNLWDSVQETNPADTKKVTFGRKFTAIDAYSQIKKATDIFGPYGTGWGIKSIVHTFVPNTNMVMGEAQFYYVNGSSKISDRGEFPVTSSILYISAKGHIDDEFAKKLETDMITKALSRLGFNADVFMGKFDDNRYVSEMNEKFKQQISPEPINTEHVDYACKQYKELITADVDEVDFKKMQAIDRRLTNDERINVMDRFGDETYSPDGKKKGRLFRTLIADYLKMQEADLHNPQDYVSG